jgi:hypothetical protein
MCLLAPILSNTVFPILYIFVRFLQICEKGILPNFKKYLESRIVQKMAKNDCQNLVLPENIGR